MRISGLPRAQVVLSKRETGRCVDWLPAGASLDSARGAAIGIVLMARTYRLSGGRKAYNQLIRGLMGMGLPMGSYRLLTVPGRRSGTPRTTPLAMLTNNGRRWLIAPYGEVGWVQNVRASGGDARLTHARSTETVRLRELPPSEAAPLLKRYLEKYRMLVGPFFDAKPGDPFDRFVSEAAHHPVFEVLPG